MTDKPRTPPKPKDPELEKLLVKAIAKMDELTRRMENLEPRDGTP
jgi:hypothetical protein